MVSVEQTTENMAPADVSGPTKISLHGEIDRATAEATMAYIRARLPLEAGDLEIDLDDVDFMGAAGLNILAQLRADGHRVSCVHAHGTAALALSTEAATRTRRRLATGVVPVPVTLADGTTLRLRPVYPDDRARLVEGAAVASARSRYRRFFNSGEISPQAARYLTDVDYRDHFCWVAMDSDDVAIGGASCVRLQAEDEQADISFSIADEYQGRGLGGLLLGALAVAARHHGISRFTADVLQENRPMRAILDRARIEWEPANGPVLHGVVEVPDPSEFGITPDTAQALGILVDEIGKRKWQSLVTPSPEGGLSASP